MDKAHPHKPSRSHPVLCAAGKTSIPGVVNIYTKKTVVERSRSPFANDPFFRQFFGGLGRAGRRAGGALAGFWRDRGSNGTVVTNRHVIDGADEIRVVLADRREFDAELVGADEKPTLPCCVLTNPPDDLSTLTFANSGPGGGGRSGAGHRQSVWGGADGHHRDRLCTWPAAG